MHACQSGPDALAAHLSTNIQIKINIIMTMEFIRVRSTGDIIISSLLTFGGIALVFLPSSISVNILGTMVAVIGIILMMTMKSEYKECISGLRYRKLIKYFPASKKADILSALKGDPSKFVWKEPRTGNGLMLEIYVCKSEKTVFARLLEYIPYNYEQCSEWFSYRLNIATPLLK